MRWSVFLIFAYLCLALEVGLDTLLHYNGVAPSFVLILAVFVGLAAPQMTVIWCMLVLGLLTDLTRSHATAQQQVLWLVGPATLGYLCAGFVMLQLRSLVLRDSLISLAVMVFVAGLFARLVTVAVLTLRGLSWFAADPVVNGSADLLVKSFGELVYSAIVALPVGMALMRSRPLWGFASSKGGSPHRHRTR